MVAASALKVAGKEKKDKCFKVSFIVHIRLTCQCSFLLLSNLQVGIATLWWLPLYHSSVLKNILQIVTSDAGITEASVKAPFSGATCCPLQRPPFIRLLLSVLSIYFYTGVGGGGGPIRPMHPHIHHPEMFNVNTGALRLGICLSPFIPARSLDWASHWWAAWPVGLDGGLCKMESDNLWRGPCRTWVGAFPCSIMLTNACVHWNSGQMK